jgi:hypothetical protein
VLSDNGSNKLGIPLLIVLLLLRNGLCVVALPGQHNQAHVYMIDSTLHCISTHTSIPKLTHVPAAPLLDLHYRRLLR